MEKNFTTSIILAAGIGKRMGELAKEIPKPLLEVDGKKLIEYAVDFVKKIGTQNIFVVGGYHFDKLQGALSRYDSRVVTINNSDYELQNILSFDRALREVKKGNILVCNADYVFFGKVAENVSAQKEGISIYCSFDLSANEEDVMKVKVDSDGNMIAMSKNLNDFNAVYTGIFYLDGKYMPLVKQCVKKIIDTVDNKIATVEYLFNELVQRGHKVKVRDIGPPNWFEVDTPTELELARKEIHGTQKH